MNPVNGAIGLLSTGNWHLCEAGVRTVLAGGTPAVLMNSSQIPVTDGTSGVAEAAGALSEMMIGNLEVASSSGDDVSDVMMSLRCSDGEEPKLLNLLV